MSDTLFVAAALVLLVSAVLWWSRRDPPPKFFDRLPPPLWCYFLPMVAATLGWLPQQSPVYVALAQYALPPCLILLLLGADVRAIAGLGPLALGVMAAGTAGIMLGAPLALALLQRWLPAQTWLGVGCLSGSWIGGSANMLAIREALGAPAAVFTPMIVVDTVLAYTWMGGLISLAAWQPQIDRWLHARPEWLDRLKATAVAPAKSRTSWWSRAGVVAAAGLLGLACVWIGVQLPSPGAWMTAKTWTVLLATSGGVAWSCHRATRRRAQAAASVGTWLLYLLLASIGATADLRSVVHAPLLLLLGVIWLLVHGLVLLVVGRVWRVPVFFLATVSQADVGGVASAPLVASVYEPSLAPVGLLLAVLGNILGTYLGLVTAALCRLVAAAYGLL